MPDQIFPEGENTHFMFKNLGGGTCFKDQNQKPQKLICFKGAAAGWQTALWSPSPLPCQAGVKWTLVSLACSICPQLLMITQTGLSTSCCPHESLVACQLAFMFLVLILLRSMFGAYWTHSI